MLETKNEVIEILKQLVIHIDVEEYFLDNDEMIGLGLDSITFIKMIIMLEEKFQFEFDDETLLSTYFDTLSKLIDYIDSKVVAKAENSKVE